MDTDLKINDDFKSDLIYFYTHTHARARAASSMLTYSNSEDFENEEFDKRIILNSSAKTCDLDIFPIHLLVECLDTLLPYVT